MGEMNWVSRKIHLYNVTMGLYMLDCCSPLTGVDIMVLILLWFICFNGSRFASDVFERDKCNNGTVLVLECFLKDELHALKKPTAKSSIFACVLTFGVVSADWIAYNGLLQVQFLNP
uniref:Uncharacterized protein n=1 Tax=Leersia perrieri TaxID=77586 RepID=A0A0D9WYC8_9ORYZ